MSTIKILQIFLLFNALWLQSLAKLCIEQESGVVKNMRNFSDDWVRLCVAHCLDLVDLTFDGRQKASNTSDKCRYNIESGLVPGPCTKTFKSNPKNDKKLMCYVDNIQNIYSRFDLMKLFKMGTCTHVQIGQFHIYQDKNNSLIFNHDLAQSYYNDLKSAANFKVKTLYNIGDWFGNYMPQDRFSVFLPNLDMRKYFIKELTSFILQYNFDGIVINWLAPSCPKLVTGCAGGFSSDKLNYVKLLREFRDAFEPGMQIVISVPGNKGATSGYDFPELDKLVDFFQLSSYDYVFHGSALVGHCSPESSLKPIMEFMKPYASKVLLGIRARVEVFKLWSKKENTITSRQVMNKGYVTSFDQVCKRITGDKSGNFSFNLFCAEPFNSSGSQRVCEQLTENVTFVAKDALKGNFAVSDTRWFCYEDYATLSKKVELVNQYGAAGMVVAGVSYDDVNNLCGCGDFGITRMTAELLRANDGCTFAPCL